eukprot:5321569-Pyramimonas_sp.AAC.1
MDRIASCPGWCQVGYPSAQGCRALDARAAMPIVWTQTIRRMGLASAFELLHLEPVLLRA